MLIDPHLNPSDLTPEDLIEKMTEASLDGAVITCTHSVQAATPYLKALLAEDPPFTCFLGVELRTEYGTVVFIPEEVSAPLVKTDWGPQGEACIEIEGVDYWSLPALESLLSSHRGVVILEHPYSRMTSRCWGDRAFTLEYIDGTETRIGRGLPYRDFLCDEISRIKGWSRLGSSGGEPQFIGHAMTVFAETVETQADLCEAIRKGICWPIEFEDPMYPRARYQGVLAQEGYRYETWDERKRRDGLQRLARQRGERLPDDRRQDFKTRHFNAFGQ